MNKCVTYTYIIILIIIADVYCSDKQPSRESDDSTDDSDDDINFDTIVKELETLVDEDDEYDFGRVSKQVEKIIDDILDETDETYGVDPNTLVRGIEKIIDDHIDEPSSKIEQQKTYPQTYQTPFNYSNYKSFYSQYKEQSDSIYPSSYFSSQPVYPPPSSTPLSSNLKYHSAVFYPRYVNPRLIPRYQKYPYGIDPGGKGVSDKPSDQPSKPRDDKQTDRPRDRPRDKPSVSRKPVKGYKPKHPKEGAFGGDEEETQKLSSFFPETKKCKTITLVKYDQGNLVEMTHEDYRILQCGSHITKYIFRSELEQVYCDDEIVYNHRPGKHYCISLNYNIQSCYFVLEFVDELLLFMFTKGKWKGNKHKNQCPFKFYTHIGGHIRQMTNDYYCIDINTKGSIKYRFCNNVYCSKVKFDDEEVWEKTTHGEYPMAICSSYNGKIIFYYDGYNEVFGKRYNKYVMLSSGKDDK
ncbi:Theileria-specific sub-telomeric protein, SVSP family [Theileria annulata]|uniref:Theileria-specific sub-telomeric protein, SVSP family n=1 Tax=Theileria annulata TaxID=5874 RepID=Q4UAT5_THEAN|nr:Theileria-specific sub-telomeric protein, SVSP family [Theileria annulata]CAI76066.1 Theileria-specific sub-telomeric protein, SVSP family [Theileria annulata]|eukprot:XP_955542.1 Theileria-specific sub-telomeric protein, SVSP family [Theileria annulata]